MIEVVKNEDGYILGVCEYLRFNDDGNFDLNGNTLAIIEFVISDRCVGSGLVRRIIHGIKNKSLGVERVIFRRANKYPDRNRMILVRC